MAKTPERERRAPDRGARGGRTASGDDLRRRLRTAPPAYLSGALLNPELQDAEMGLLLRNRNAGPDLLTRIARDRHWSGRHEIRKALVRHPKTPVGVARGLLAHLFWRDLLETADDPRVPAAVRRQAETLLRNAVAGLTRGEKITLARRVGPALFAVLRESDDAAVLEAFLENPRLRESDVLPIAAGEHVPVEALRFLAERSRWGARRTIRIALAKNPKTPIPVSLRLVARLSVEDLHKLDRDDCVPTIVRVGVDRRLGRAAGSAPRSGIG